MKFLFSAALCLFFQSNAFPHSTLSEAEVTRLENKINETICSPKLTQEEFVLTAYEQVYKEKPNIEKFDSILGLLRTKDDRGGFLVSKGNAVSILIAEKNESITKTNFLNQLREFKPCQKAQNFNRKSLIKSIENFDPLVWEPTRLKARKHSGKYKPYFGLTHSHTFYSDGMGSPEEAFEMARDKANLDFFAVTEHSEFLPIPPWINKWQSLKNLSNKYTVNNKFVALYGFEWSSPLYGHVNVYNSEKFITAFSFYKLRHLYDWLAKQSGLVFATFNHPGRDFWLFGSYFEFERLRPHKYAFKRMIGIEGFNKSTGVKEYYNKVGYFDSYNYFMEANQRGWMVAPTGGQDNHEKDWGVRADFRTGIHAKSLTKKDIILALLERRSFVTDDKNAWVSFKIDGGEMGSRLLPGKYSGIIDYADKENENLSLVKLFRNGELLEEFQGSQLPIKFNVNTKNKDFYHVLLIQEDDDYIVSSPIWIVPR